ncbi:MAG: hypothetical protein GY719_08465, partial [bacterium]|nr:hypothetical protein [bacterium]
GRMPFCRWIDEGGLQAAHASCDRDLLDELLDSIDPELEETQRSLVLSEVALSHPWIRMLLGRAALFYVPGWADRLERVEVCLDGGCRELPPEPLVARKIRHRPHDLRVEMFADPEEPWPGQGHAACTLRWESLPSGRFDVHRAPPGDTCDASRTRVSCAKVGPAASSENAAMAAGPTLPRDEMALFEFRDIGDPGQCRDALTGDRLATGASYDYCVCSSPFGLGAACMRIECVPRDRRPPAVPDGLKVVYRPVVRPDPDGGARQVIGHPLFTWICDDDPLDSYRYALYRSRGTLDELQVSPVAVVDHFEACWHDGGTYVGRLEDLEVNTGDHCTDVFYYCLTAIDPVGNESGCSAPVRAALPCTRHPKPPEVTVCGLVPPTETDPDGKVDCPQAVGSDPPLFSSPGVGARIETADPCDDLAGGGQAHVYRQACGASTCDGPLVKVGEVRCDPRSPPSPTVDSLDVEDPDPCPGQAACRVRYAVEHCNVAGLCSVGTVDAILRSATRPQQGVITGLQAKPAEGTLSYRNESALSAVQVRIETPGGTRLLERTLGAAPLTALSPDGTYRWTSRALRDRKICVVVTPVGIAAGSLEPALGPASRHCHQVETSGIAPWPRPAIEARCLSAPTVRRALSDQMGCGGLAFGDDPGGAVVGFSWAIRPPFLAYRRIASLSGGWEKISPLFTGGDWLGIEREALDALSPPAAVDPEPSFVRLRQGPPCHSDFQDLLPLVPGYPYEYRFVEIDPDTGHPRGEVQIRGSCP